MKPSETTNKELAKRLETHIVPISGCVGSRALGLEIAADVGEAARRLRKVTVRTDNSAVIAELQRRIKLAEDALVRCVTCDNSEELERAKREAKNALAAIRGEGGAK